MPLSDAMLINSRRNFRIDVLQLIDACMTNVIEFNTTTTCMIVVQNKCTHVMVLLIVV